MEKCRIPAYDTIRAFAVLMIVLDHAVMIGYKIYYASFLDVYTSMTTISKLFCFTMYEISRLGVPLFLMLTGALVLSKDFSTDENIGAFYKKNLLPLLILNEIWVCVFWILFYLLEKNGMSFIYTEGSKLFFNKTEFIQQITLQKRAFSPNMWYIPAIIGFYVFIPFVSLLAKHVYRWGGVLAISFLPFLISDLNTIMRVEALNFTFSSVLHLSFSGGIYGVYIVLGYYLSKIDLTRFPKYTPVFLISFLIVVLTCTVLYMERSYHLNRPEKIFGGNDSLCQLMITVTIFLLAKYTKRNYILELISKKSMGIYLFHYPLMIFLCYKIVGKRLYLNYGSSKFTIVLFVSTFILSLLLTLLIPNNKIIRRYGFHIS